MTATLVNPVRHARAGIEDVVRSRAAPPVHLITDKIW